jgi:hypothetical protein
VSRFTTADLPLARGPSAAAAHNSAIPPALGGIGAPVSWSQQQQLGSIGGASAEPVRVAIQVRIACWSASVRSPCGVPAGVDTHSCDHPPRWIAASVPTHAGAIGAAADLGLNEAPRCPVTATAPTAPPSDRCTRVSKSCGRSAGPNSDAPHSLGDAMLAASLADSSCQLTGLC